jgi:hypothetical protein
MAKTRRSVATASIGFFKRNGYSAMKMNRPWSEIYQSYARLNGEPANSMLRLVSAIEASPYASGLFAWTSMMDLCIAQTPAEYPYKRPGVSIHRHSR